MIHRCWRLGQKKETKIIVLQHADTVEKQIWLAVQNKQKIEQKTGILCPEVHYPDKVYP